jgi:hypothetical protein
MIESTFWAEIVSIFESGHFTDQSVLVAEKPESLDTKADNAENEVTKQESQVRYGMSVSQFSSFSSFLTLAPLDLCRLR